MNYYYLVDGKTIGPVSLGELVKVIAPDTLIWCDDGSVKEWQHAKDLSTVSNLLQRLPPPPPSPSIDSKLPPPPPIDQKLPPPLPQTGYSSTAAFPPPNHNPIPATPENRNKSIQQGNRFNVYETGKSTGSTKKRILIILGVLALLILGIYLYNDYYNRKYERLKEIEETEDVGSNNSSKDATSNTSIYSNDESSIESEQKNAEVKSTKQQCISCDGTGRVDDGGECDHCEGSGWLNFAHTFECTECNGSGKKSHSCTSCDGTGWVNL
jgi:hypothetical protein